MSDAGANIEVEDVLASIRRLVSQDAASVRPAQRPAPVGATGGQASDCLVLTPALRITGRGAARGEGQPGAAAPEVVPAAAAEAGETLSDELHRLEDSIAALEASVVAAPEGGEAPARADAGPEEADAEEAGADASAAAPVDASAGTASSGEDLSAEDRSVEDGASTARLGAGDVAASPATDGALGEAGVDAFTGTEGDAPTLAAAAETPASDEAGEAAASQWSAAEWEDEATDADGATDQGAEASEGLRRLHLDDARETAARPEIRRSSYDALRGALEDDEENAFSPADEDRDEAPLVDEEALRALVAQIIREELRGVLGEKITRNVRKLVRREIQRVLMANDMEE